MVERRTSELMEYMVWYGGNRVLRISSYRLVLDGFKVYNNDVV